MLVFLMIGCSDGVFAPELVTAEPAEMEMLVSLGYELHDLEDALGTVRSNATMLTNVSGSYLLISPRGPLVEEELAQMEVREWPDGIEFHPVEYRPLAIAPDTAYTAYGWVIFSSQGGVRPDVGVYEGEVEYSVAVCEDDACEETREPTLVSIPVVATFTE